MASIQPYKAHCLTIMIAYTNKYLFSVLALLLRQGATLSQK